jgi:hypothetical protein
MSLLQLRAVTPSGDATSTSEYRAGLIIDLYMYISALVSYPRNRGGHRSLYSLTTGMCGLRLEPH